MTRPRIVVTRKLPSAVEARLRRLFEVSLNSEDTPFGPSRLAAALRHADGLLPTVSDRIDAAVLGQSGVRARIIANFGVGTNNIDLAAAGRAGIAVTNTPDVLTDATADIAVALMLNVTRRTWEMENLLRAGKWTGFSPSGNLGTGLQGKVLGIVGMGRIGQAVARRARAGFGMRVIYFNRSPLSGAHGQAVNSIEEVMSLSDIVSLHFPGSADNKGLISDARLRLMKPSAILINTARGDIIDEKALINALIERRIAGAGLDVFAEEPQVPAELRALKNVSLLPHLGSATIETRTAMGMKAVDNLEAYFEGRALPDRVA